jgi:hypothetical protein
MLEIGNRKVWLYREVIDFRKQMNGLIQIIVDEKKQIPNDESIYVFRNRQRDKVKLLTWHHNGFFLGYKRLERGRFDFGTDVDGVEISADELRQLMSGMPMIYLGKGSKNNTVFS